MALWAPCRRHTTTLPNWPNFQHIYLRVMFAKYLAEFVPTNNTKKKTFPVHLWIHLYIRLLCASVFLVAGKRGGLRPIMRWQHAQISLCKCPRFTPRAVVTAAKTTDDAQMLRVNLAGGAGFGKKYSCKFVTRAPNVGERVPL